MNPYWQSSAGTRDDAELEALQTDVMRFVAILGLCLAAIFSLVQTLSAAGGEAPTEVRAEILIEQLEQVDEQKEEWRMRNQALAELHEDIRQERQRLRRMNRNLERQAREQQESVARPRESLPRETITEQQTPAETRDETPARKPSLEQSPLSDTESVPVSETEPRVEPSPEQASQQQGYRLGFASADALRSLLRSGRVRLYAGTGGRYWRLDLRAGGFVAEAAPTAFYQMDYSTVPGDIVALFRRSVAGNQLTLDWGVTLPDKTVTAIRLKMRERPGGDLQIAADGAVHWG